MTAKENEELGCHEHVGSILLTELVYDLLSPLLSLKINVHSLILPLGYAFRSTIEYDVEHHKCVQTIQTNGNQAHLNEREALRRLHKSPFRLGQSSFVGDCVPSDIVHSHRR